MSEIDHENTKRWIWNEADEIAYRNGCWFDESRAEHFADVCETHLRLWEGDYAGKPLRLTNWQWDCLGRIFGWVVWSEKWGRFVRRFKIASCWVAKKNKKSPTGAAVGLYLTRWDGEPGAKVWSAAKDGKQAGIVHGHAINMIKASGLDEFHINKTDRKISYAPTMSEYGVMAGDNIEGQEGWNGSVIIDECHVVDDRLARVIADMGASRSEALRFEISTAGSDLGYGRKQYEYGKEVESGRIEDQAFFFKAYEAPQDATDEQILAFDDNGDITQQTMDLWSAANPALGETIDIDEMINSCKRARRSEHDWSGWKQRRLNIWQFAADAWISKGVWGACAHTFDLSDAEGCELVGCGLDLARKYDTSSAVYAWEREDGTIGLWPRIWLPKGRIGSLAVKVQEFRDWADQGHLLLTTGDTVDFDEIQELMVADIKRLGVSTLAYDPFLASEFTKRIWDETRVELVEFKQDHHTYTVPVGDFERLAIEHKLRHPSNPVWNWQMSHAMISERGNKEKPVKDNYARHKRIDTVQAGIMALYALQESRGAGSFYDDHEVEVF